MEEILKQIVSKLDSLESGQQEIKSDIREMKTDIKGVKEELTNVKTEMRSSFKHLETKQDELIDVVETLAYKSIQQEKEIRNIKKYN